MDEPDDGYDPQSDYADYPEGEVHVVGQAEPGELIGDVDDPDSDVYAVVDDLVVVKVSHSIAHQGNQQSWYTAGLTSRLDPGESPADGLRRVRGTVMDVLIESINEDWPVVADLHTQIHDEIVRRDRARPIKPRN